MRAHGAARSADAANQGERGARGRPPPFLDDARRALGDLACLFTPKQNRLSRELDEERMRFLAGAVPAALSQLDEAIGAAPRREGLFLAAERIAEQAVREWLERIEPRAERLYARATDRFADLAHEFLRRVGTSDVRERAEEIGIEAHAATPRSSGRWFTGV